MTPKNIIIHHSLTRDGLTVSWDDIRRYHIEVNGWRDIGYHFGIELIDSTGNYEILLGRFPNERGAHCIPRNHDSIGICLIGNFDLAPPEKEQWDKAVSLCDWLCETYHIERILGHGEADDRSCPGRYFDMDKFRLDMK